MAGLGLVAIQLRQFSVLYETFVFPMQQILIADEHAVYCNELARILRALGYEVITSENWSDLPTKLALSPAPSLAIINYKTTRQRSIENTLWVRKNYPQIPIIVTCLFATVEIMNKLRPLGIKGLVMKGGNTEGGEIIIAIRAVLEGKEYFRD